MAWKKGLYRCCINGIAVLSLAAPAWGAAPDKPGIATAKIGKKELVSAIGVTIVKGDLTLNGEVLLAGKAEGGGKQITKVEVSLDGGKTWKEAQGRESWRYSFIPVPRKTYELTLRAANAAGICSDFKTFGMVKLSYLPITLSALISRRTDELATAYMSRDLERYMSLISKGYHRYPEGLQRLRRVINNDFKSRNNIVLRFTVNQVFELEGAIMADIRWRLTYAGLAKPEEGYVEIQFDPVDQLKILVQEKDRYFGAASP